LNQQAGRRIQIVNVNQKSFIPLEYVYDYPVPKMDATLCPNAKKALLKGSCMGCIPEAEMEEGPTSYVCPFGFWGLSRVIERHISFRQESHPGAPRPSEYALTFAPVQGREVLVPFSKAVYAATDKVNSYEKDPDEVKPIERVLNAVDKVMPGRVRHVINWDEWQEAVKENPTLLILLSHTGKKFDQPMLQIGSEEDLPIEYINKNYVRIDETAQAPIVLLFGCQTGLAAGADIPFQSVANAFRQSEAAVVVSTQIEVRGRHIVPLTEIFIEILDRLIRDGDVDQSFGDVMLALRREVLARGLPVVLTLFSFGDADWQLIEEP
jgi:hypothetical protein